MRQTYYKSCRRNRFIFWYSCILSFNRCSCWRIRCYGMLCRSCFFGLYHQIRYCWLKYYRLDDLHIFQTDIVNKMVTVIFSYSALICGTSTCHMAQTKTEIYVPGIWGPFYNTMIPDLWLLKGGQSVSGKLIDYIIDTHPASAAIKEKCTNM